MTAVSYTHLVENMIVSSADLSNSDKTDGFLKKTCLLYTSITMPDFLKYRYTPRTGSWLSIITLIAYILTTVSVTAYTGGIFLEFLLGLPFWYGACLLYTSRCV